MRIRPFLPEDLKFFFFGWDDLYSTGFFDYLDTDNVLVIEWSENIDGALPENTIYVHMEKGETETERIITIEGIDL